MRLDDLPENPSSDSCDNFFESEKCPELPISTKEKFDEFNEKLKDKAFLKQVVSLL